MNTGVYLHIPFCRAKCDYCGFYSVPLEGMDRGSRARLLERYAAKLVREIGARAHEAGGAAVDTLYLGGGTPSLLSPDTVGLLIGAVRDALSLGPGAEITLECNPEDFSPARIAEYRDAGVNRVVLGVQALREEDRRALGRRARLCDEAMLGEFMNVPGITHCMDYIAGVPGKSPGGVREDMQVIAGARPAHISAYMLAIEKGTPLAARLKTSFELERAQREAFETLMDTLAENAYRHYEISNFAQPGFESRHNLKYWKFMPYLGFGASAHSFSGGTRYYNAQSVDEYMNDGGPALVRDERSPRAAAAEFIMTGLRLLEGISVSRFEEALGAVMPEEVMRRFEMLGGEGLVALAPGEAGTVVRLTREGLFRADEVIFRAVEPCL